MKMEITYRKLTVHGCGSVQITAFDTCVLLYTDFRFVRNGNFMQYKF